MQLNFLKLIDFSVYIIIKPKTIKDFDVYIDGSLIFSKKKEGRFPNEGEVERLIKNQS